MSVAAVPIPQGAQIQNPPVASSSPIAQPPRPGTPVPIPQGAQIANAEPETDPSKTGEITNDVGNKVIVPKDGEDFADTMKRAVLYHKSLTPQQQQAAIDKETATMPEKTAETLAGAATIGAVGPALMAAPGEIGELAGPAAEQAKTFILKKLAEQTPELFGHEAVKATLRRYAMAGVKRAISGGAWAGGAEVLHSIWEDVFGK